MTHTNTHTHGIIAFSILNLDFLATRQAQYLNGFFWLNWFPAVYAFPSFFWYPVHPYVLTGSVQPDQIQFRVDSLSSQRAAFSSEIHDLSSALKRRNFIPNRRRNPLPTRGTTDVSIQRWAGGRCRAKVITYKTKETAALTVQLLRRQI